MTKKKAKKLLRENLLEFYRGRVYDVNMIMKNAKIKVKKNKVIVTHNRIVEVYKIEKTLTLKFFK